MSNFFNVEYNKSTYSSARQALSSYFEKYAIYIYICLFLYFSTNSITYSMYILSKTSKILTYSEQLYYFTISSHTLVLGVLFNYNLLYSSTRYTIVLYFTIIFYQVYYCFVSYYSAVLGQLIGIILRKISIHIIFIQVILYQKTQIILTQIQYMFVYLFKGV